MLGRVMLTISTSRDSGRISTNKKLQLIIKAIFSLPLTTNLLDCNLTTIKEATVNVDNPIRYHLVPKIHTSQQVNMIIDQKNYNKR
jgi:hypothetical protein